MDNNGQGALEYLLLIGGALLLVAIILALLGTFSGQGKNQANEGLNQFYNKVNV